MIFPRKLKAGDEVRIIAPAFSYQIIGEDVRKIATERLEQMGLKVSFGKNLGIIDSFVSSPIDARIQDLHDAYADKNVKAIFTVIGGFNSNQLLGLIDFEQIKQNPKMLIGYSDIAALQNAILAKTGIVSYYGPHFSSLGMKYGADYTLDYLRRILFDDSEFFVQPCQEWSDDPEWFINQEDRHFNKNDGFWIINSGSATGTLIGGEMTTFQLLYGTQYMPTDNDLILALEIEGGNKHILDRILQSTIHQPWFKNVRGLVIGRTESKSEVSRDDIVSIFNIHPELKNIPVVANVDFGHTYPMTVLPLGGTIKISDGALTVIKH